MGSEDTTADSDRKLPATCFINSWPIFAPGYWRGALYTLADCRRLVENFNRLKQDEYVDPVVKLGHSRQQKLQQRLRESLGFLNLGDFAALQIGADGVVRAWLKGIPTAVGAQINAGGIRSGSVELIPWIADPGDPSKRVQGPILTGVALLGEEHPAVKGVVARPKAVFADGTPVPPATDPAPWLEAMTEVAKMSVALSDDADPTFKCGDHTYPVTAICFSEMDPMDNLDPEFLQSIGLNPEQIQEILGKLGGGQGSTGAIPPPVPGDAAASAKTGPAPIPTGKETMSHDDQTMMSAGAQKAFAEFTKRLTAHRPSASRGCGAAAPPDPVPPRPKRCPETPNRPAPRRSPVPK